MLFRVQKDRENPYVMMNKSFLLDARLSAKAKGVLSYILTLPDDWKIYLEELSKHFKDGIKSITSGVNELIEYGYISRTTLRDEKGKFKGYMYDVFEVSSETPKTENGKTENGKSEFRKGHTTNKVLKVNNNIQNNNNTATTVKEKDVVVTLQTKSLLEQFKEKYYADLDPKRARALIQLKGVDYVLECVATYKDYIQGRTIRNVGGDFYKFVTEGYTKPVSANNTHTTTTPTYANFDQRTYTEEDYEQFYANVKR